MDILTAIRTNGAVRSFTDDAVADATVFDILDDARFAPSGGNRQGWRVAIVTDAPLRRELAALMRPVWDEYVQLSQLGRTPFTVVDAAEVVDAPRSSMQPMSSMQPSTALPLSSRGTSRTLCSMTSRRSRSCSSLLPISAASLRRPGVQP